MIKQLLKPAQTDLLELIENMSLVLEEQSLSCDEEDPVLSAGDMCPIILNPFGEGSQLVMAEFGMSPAWAKYSVSYPSVNAPMETITGVKTYRKPYRKSQFCLVPISGFYSTDGSLIHKSTLGAHFFGSLVTVPALYEYNHAFAEPKHSFSLLTRQVDEAFTQALSVPNTSTWLLEIKPEKREYFLVSNWKFIKGYMQLFAQPDLV